MTFQDIFSDSKGYIALTSVIVITAILFAITFSLSFSGFFVRFNILDSEFKEQSINVAEACADIALIELANDINYSGGVTITLGNNTCEILLIDPPSGGELTVRTKADIKSAVTNIEVVVEEDGLDIVSWQEVPNFP